jgi:hypothetical protein
MGDWTAEGFEIVGLDTQRNARRGLRFFSEESCQCLRIATDVVWTYLSASAFRATADVAKVALAATVGGLKEVVSA